VSSWLDTNVLVRHLTGDPPAMARRATRFLAEAEDGELLLADVIVAELVYVMESVYVRGRNEVAQAVRAAVTDRAVTVVDAELLLRAAEVYELDRLDFAEAYLVANAERSGVGAVATFDRSVRRATTVRTVEP
jgi:predicted nucleic-acid-binding protein